MRRLIPPSPSARSRQRREASFVFCRAAAIAHRRLGACASVRLRFQPADFPAASMSRSLFSSPVLQRGTASLPLLALPLTFSSAPAGESAPAAVVAAPATMASAAGMVLIRVRSFFAFSPVRGKRRKIVVIALCCLSSGGIPRSVLNIDLFRIRRPTTQACQEQARTQPRRRGLFCRIYRTCRLRERVQPATTSNSDSGSLVVV
jgi:hypothetical protein